MIADDRGAPPDAASGAHAKRARSGTYRSPRRVDLACLSHVVLTWGRGAALLASSPALERVRELAVACERPDDASARVPRGASAAGALLDLELGLAACEEIRDRFAERWPGAPMLAHAPDASDGARELAAQLGVALHDEGSTSAAVELTSWMIAAHTRRLVECERIATRCERWRLTPRQAQLAALTALGTPRGELARALGLARSSASALVCDVLDASGADDLDALVAQLR